MKILLMSLIEILTCHNMSVLVLVLVLLNFKMSHHSTFPTKAHSLQLGHNLKSYWQKWEDDSNKVVKGKRAQIFSHLVFSNPSASNFSDIISPRFHRYFKS